MTTAEELARFHLETAAKLTSPAFIAEWVAQHGGPVVPAVVTATTTTTASSNRGRKPGAAPETERCEWTLVAGGQCKNRRMETGSFCKIHIGKIHLVDPTTH
jgi:hypothetical protein